MRQAGNPIDAPWEGGRWGFFFEVAFLITLRRCKAWFPLLFVFQDRFKLLGQSCHLVWIRFLADSFREAAPVTRLWSHVETALLCCGFPQATLDFQARLSN